MFVYVCLFFVVPLPLVVLSTSAAKFEIRGQQHRPPNCSKLSEEVGMKFSKNIVNILFLAKLSQSVLIKPGSKAHNHIFISYTRYNA